MIEEKILKLCMKVNGVIAYYPQYNEIAQKPLEPDPDMVGKYGWNNNVVSFVTSDGSYYVTPYCVEVVDYLVSHGFTNGYIYVPFSNSDEPSDGIQAQAWKKLCYEAKELHNQKEKERRSEEIKNISRAKGIKELPDELYEMVLRIPSDGLKIRLFLHDDSVTNPVPVFNLREAIGTYDQNNSRLTFVDDKGHTYVTPYCHEVRELLKANGYVEGDLYVPLSNGEEIVDPNTKDIWEKLCMGAKVSSNMRRTEEKKVHMAEIARAKGIAELAPDIYRLTFEIPTEGIETVWYGEQTDITEPVSEWSLDTAVGTYCQNNGRLVFVDDKGRTYVTPFCSEIRSVLAKSGYREGSLAVPFSNGEMPVNEIAALKWKQLCNLARQAFEKREEERKIIKLNDLARAKHVKVLPILAYQLSFKIPKEGFETIFFESDKDITRPAREWELEKVLGTYCQNNGRLVFVDDKGDTYVTPHCDEVTEILKSAGYKKGALAVPLSNGEKIVNEDLRKKWEALCSRLPEAGN